MPDDAAVAVDVDSGRFQERFALPAVAPVADADGDRPWLTVALPVYVSDPRDLPLLERALRGVLVYADQHPDVEILVVDDASPHAGVEDFIRQVVGDRALRYVCNEHNLHAVGNIQRCVDLSRGEWVHVLHDDDAVTGQFYQRVRQLINEHPDVDQIVTQVASGTDVRNPALTMRITADAPVVFDDWFERISEFSLIWHTGVVTRRRVYEQVGNWGFATDWLSSGLVHNEGGWDWEWMLRLPLAGHKTLFVPEVLAFYNQGTTGTSATHHLDLDLQVALNVMAVLERYLGAKAARRHQERIAHFYLSLVWREVLQYAEFWCFASARHLLESKRCRQLETWLPAVREQFDNARTMLQQQNHEWHDTRDFFNYNTKPKA